MNLTLKIVGAVSFLIVKAVGRHAIAYGLIYGEAVFIFRLFTPLHQIGTIFNIVQVNNVNTESTTVLSMHELQSALFGDLALLILVLVDNHLAVVLRQLAPFRERSFGQDTESLVLHEGSSKSKILVLAVSDTCHDYKAREFAYVYIGRFIKIDSNII